MTRFTFVTVLRRELRGMLAAPQTYAVATAWAVISGVFFVSLLVSSQVPDLNQYYSNVAATLVVLVPIVAMRSFAEERKAGSLDLVLSWPLSRTGLVLGKFAANTLFIWVLVSLVWIYIRILSGLADIDGARATGGYIGLLFLATAFSAIALAVSARASSPTGAAFIGFGVLLFLWILEYAPGFLRDSLRSLAPTVHFETFPRGVLFMEDVAYFVMITVAGLGMAAQALTRHRPGPASRSMVHRVALLAVPLLLVTATPAVARNIEGEVDLTASQRNRIAPATRDVLGTIDSTIKITAFVRPISVEATNLRSLVKQYRSAGAEIDVRQVDPDTQPGVARQFGVREYNNFIVELDGKSEKLTNLDQIGFTSALNRLKRPDPPTACFTIGHGERDMFDVSPLGASGLRKQLRQLGWNVEPLAVAAPGGVDKLKNCTVVLIIGPRVPFSQGEFDLLAEFAEQQGRMIVMPDGGTEGGHRQLSDLVRPWGLAFGDGLVHDASSVADDPTSVVSFDYPSKSPVVRDLDLDNVPTVVTNAAPVERTVVTEGDESESYVIDLIRSSEKSWVDGPEVARRKGPFLLAAVTDLTKVVGSGRQAENRTTRIAAVGSADVASNRFVAMWGNKQFLTSLVQWVGMENDIITAHRDPGGVYKLVLTRAQRDDLVRRSIVFPALAMLVPLPISLYRLKRG
jgi:ABC-2 type transport system permease protein